MAVQDPRPAEPSATGSSRWTTVAVLAVALVARLLYWRFAIPGYEPLSDDAQYHEIASNIANGDGFSMIFPQLERHATAFRPPLYPYLLGGVFAVVGGPSVAWGQALNLVIGVVVVYLTIRLGRRIGGPAVGIVAGLLVALMPSLIANDVVLLTEPLSLVLLLACVLALLQQRWLLAGLLCGLLVLSRPSAQFLVVALVLWVWSSRRGPFAATDATPAAPSPDRGRPPVLAPVLLVLAGTALAVAPWVVRNQVALGDPTLVTSNGFNLAALYSPQATASGRFVDPVRDPRFEEHRFAQLDEVAWQRELQALAWGNIRTDPGAVARVVGLNVRAYFEIRPGINDAPERLDGRNLTVRTWSLPLFYANLVLGVIGLYRLRRTAAGQLLIVAALYFVVSSLFFIAAPRVRAPVDLILCLGSAVTLVHLWSRWSLRAAAGDPPGSSAACDAIAPPHATTDLPGRGQATSGTAPPG